MKKPKKIPWCQSDFERIRTQNYLYVDKTRFIEMITPTGLILFSAIYISAKIQRVPKKLKI